MQKLSLKAEERKPKEKKSGKLSAVLYGPKIENQPIFVDTAEFKKIWKQAGETTVVTIGETQTLIYDVQTDPVSGEPIHADFYAVDMTKKTMAEVPLEFIGEAPAVKLGGILVKVLHEVEVEALPADLPHEIKVDVSGLENFESKISVADLKVEEGVKIMAEPDETVVLVEEPKAEVAEETPKTIEDIEVEKKGKKEESEAAEGKEEENKN